MNEVIINFGWLQPVQLNLKYIIRVV